MYLWKTPLTQPKQKGFGSLLFKKVGVETILEWEGEGRPEKETGEGLGVYLGSKEEGTMRS